jgi:phosphoglycolate phosphatase
MAQSATGVLAPEMQTARHPARWRQRDIGAVLFDLDGTLLDTVGDIALALNRSLAERDIPAIDLDVVRTMIGRGAPMLINRTFERNGRSVDESDRAAIFQRFLHHYADLHERHESTAEAFPHVGVALRRLRESGLRLAVVTNKHRSLAVRSLEHTGLIDVFEHVIGGDTCERRKPDPQPLQHACALLGVPTSHAIMIGDSMNDVSAARGADMPVLCVPYGYNEGHDPRSLPADQIIESFAELPPLLLGQ